MSTASNEEAKLPAKTPSNKVWSAFLKSEQGIWNANRFMVFFAAVALFGMMMITVADIIGRYFFNAPITGAFEIVGFMLAMAGPWGMGYCQVKKGHVRVDFILNRLPKKAQAILTSITYLIGTGIYGIMTWRVILDVQYYLNLRFGGSTDTLGIPIYPFEILLAIGCGMFALVTLFDMVHSIAEVKQK